MSKTASAARNLDGQRLGRKGVETRDRLISAVATLLEHKAVRELRVADIAREAGAPAPSFYRYFESVDDILLATIAERASTGPTLFDLVRQPWMPGRTRARATEFAAAFLSYWEEHFALLHARNTVADEGDERFARLRWSAISPLFDELAAKIAERQASGHVAADVEPRSMAGVLMSSLERMGAGAGPTSRARSDFPREQLAAAMGYVMSVSLGDPPVDGAAE